MKNNWPAMIIHLNNLASSSAAEAILKKREKAEELLEMISSLTFVFMMNFMSEFLVIMKDMSLLLQRNDITLDRLVDKVTTVKKISAKTEESPATNNNQGHCCC